jgi:hypothetical protein
MSRTTDSGVGRTAPRADGATKADAAAMTVRVIRWHQCGGDRPSQAGPHPVRSTSTFQQGARGDQAPVRGISTPRSAPWWAAGLATGR